MGTNMVRRLLRTGQQCVVLRRAHEAPRFLGGGAGRVSDSGEGRWRIRAAIDEAVPAPVLSAARYGRSGSSGEANFADKMPSARRHDLGGHGGKAAGTKGDA
jgi:6-phosphogluconate dehydrogenase